MLKIGITGGIGSGKTTVCKIFETLDIPIYYADDRAKALMVESDVIREQLKKEFGAAAYLENGALNRAHIANIAFSDPKKLAYLNAVVHPAVAEDAATWQAAQTSPYTIKEAALLFESGSYRALDAIITVYAPKSIRIERVMQRDNTSRAAVLSRLNKQMPDMDKLNLADYIITNNGYQPLIPQVLAIHQQLLK